MNVYAYQPETEQWRALLPCAGCVHDTVANRFTLVLDEATLFALVGDRSRHYLPLVVR